MQLRSAAVGWHWHHRWSALLILFIVLAALVPTVQAQTPSCTSEAPVATSVSSTASTQRIYAFGVQNTTSVLFPTWWIPGGQNDLQWLQGTNLGNGTWYVDVPLAQYDVGDPKFGSFETDVYLSNATNSNVPCGGGNWTRSAVAQAAGTGEIYLYDANSRLSYLSTSAGTNNYDYDPLGNILGITQFTPASITSLSPEQGSVGTQVTIHGGPFPTGSTTVAFNGPSAAATMLDANDLTVNVPTGANTGYVAATFSDGTVAVSPDIFTVLPSGSVTPGAQPVILSFSPASGTANVTNVTVTGSNFLPIPGQTVVRLGGTQVAPSTLTNTQIVFKVPVAQGTANIYVTTPYGTAVSATPLMVPLTSPSPNPIVQLTLGGSAQTLALSGSGACGAFTFSGQASTWISLQINSLTTTPSGGSVNYLLYGPNNQPVVNLNNQQFNNLGTTPVVCGLRNLEATSGNVGPTNLSLHLPPLPSSGNYTVLFDSGSASAVSISAALIGDPIIPFGGTAATSIGSANQSQRIQFTGALGQLLVVDVTATTVPTGASLTSTWLDVQGLPVDTPANNASTGQTVTLVAGPETAYGGMLLSSTAGTTGTAQITLDTSNTATVTIDGPTVPVSQTTAGKATRLGLSLSAGQAVTLATTQVATAASSLNLSLFDPYGGHVADLPCPVSGGVGNCSWDLSGIYWQLPAFSGIYTLVLTPSDTAATYSANVTLSSDLAAPLVSGTYQTVNLTRPGQTQRLSYTASVSKPILINVLNSSGSPTTDGISAWAYDATNPTSVLQADWSKNSKGKLYWFDVYVGEPVTLQLTPDSSSEGVVVGRGVGSTGSANVLLDETLPVATLNPANTNNPVKSTVSSAYAGQAKQLKYSNPSNYGVNLTLSNMTTSDGNGAIRALVFYAGNSQGTLWSQAYFDAGSCALTAGTCTFAVPPSLYGGGPAVVVLFPYGGPNDAFIHGLWEPLPPSRAVTFHAKVTLQAQ